MLRVPHAGLPFRSAFTLVELLVVIGIIALLISILLPVLGKVKRDANTVKCEANLRTLGQAWQLYATAHKDTCVPVRLPSATRFGGPIYSTPFGLHYRPRWYELLGYQLKTYPRHTANPVEDDSWQVESPLFICPEIPEWTNSRNYTYGYNYQFLGNARPKTDDPSKVTTTDPDAQMIKYPVRTGNIKGSTTVMIVDSMGTAAGKPRADRFPYYADGTHDIRAMGNKGFHIDPPRLTADSDYADDLYRNPPDRSGPDPRHNGKANALFCDGHVERMTLQEMGYVVRPDGSQDINGTNRYFSGSGEDRDPPIAR